MLISSTKAPILGFNSYDCWGPDMNEERALSNLDAFIRKLKPAGYEYFCFDAGWFLHGDYMDRLNNDSANVEKAMDEFGRLIPSPLKFPRGLKFFTDKCHENGIKFGLHFMRGIPRLALERNTKIKGTDYHARDIADPDNDCTWGPENVGVDMDKPGAQQYYDSVIEFFAENGVDFIKVDDMADQPREIEAVANAIRKVDRPIFFSLSPGDNVFRNNFPHIRSAANMLRITGDIWDRPWDLQKAFDRWEQWEDLGSPECWLDLDMIPFGMLQLYIPEDLPKDHVPHDLNEKRASRLSLIEKRTFMTQRAMAASPLLFGGDLSLSPDEDIALVTHPQILACNQDGITAKRIYGERGIDVRRKFSDPEQQHGWVAVFNRKGADYHFRLPVSALDLPDAVRVNDLRDIWTETAPEFPDGANFSFSMPAWGCVLYHF